VVKAIGGDTMKNVMTYKRYTARIEFDQRDNIFTGKIMGIEDGITFHGETVKELRADFQAAIDHYIADCEATGRSPLKVASGKMMLRVSPEVHARALATAKTAGKSLNQWAEEVLDKAANV
jgi:predicted HicB family RNase H-like nuclease